MELVEQYYNERVLAGIPASSQTSFASLTPQQQNVIANSVGYAGYRVNRAFSEFSEALKKAYSL